ncbi:rod shape-determining protein MreC [Blattabacterium cuenoti]|uniref:rod shape-determining protein MreC n=1 Tax=Blattabacterium cuenoti TaxID=1653831 RepID=UPI00163BBDDE|nr:rod shape-determining protein MreC [Blattabacterium cuenoti]
MCDFFFKWRFCILFFLLESVSIFFSFKNLNVICNSPKFIIGKVYESIYEIQNYFLLKIENDKLLKENSRLHNESIYSYIIKNSNSGNFRMEDIKYLQQYIYTPVQIINNSIYKQENYITLNKGNLDGIKPDMGVILPSGIAGIVIKTTPHFSKAISLLNLRIKINARIKKDNNFGTISWDGNDYKYVILNDIPKYCAINKGDIVETDGKSYTFPEGIPIGTVYSYKLDDGNSNFIIKVKLFENFSIIENAYVVNNILKKELDDIYKVENK